MEKTLEARVLHVMKTNNVDSVYVATDGNIFLPNKKSLADYHAKQNKVKINKVTIDDLTDETETDESDETDSENKVEPNNTVTDKKQK
jgi:hypothetical protein